MISIEDDPLRMSGDCPNCEYYRKRIAELEGQVTSLQLIEKQLIQYCADHKKRIKELEAALHEISLCSKNSMSSKEECGRIARQALEQKGIKKPPGGLGG